MTSYVTSRNGTKLAFDRLGDGPPVVVVGGMFCDRRRTRPLAERLAERLSVINYDRRGRGESRDTPPYAVAWEVEDLAALIAEAGGAASPYGHSSGAGLALNAAAGGLPVTRLVLHEPPYGPDDKHSTRSARDLAENVGAAIAAGRPADAIRLFMADSGLPEEMIDGMAGDQGMLSIAPTMPYDHEVMGDASRGARFRKTSAGPCRSHVGARRRGQPGVLPGHRRADRRDRARRHARRAGGPGPRRAGRRGRAGGRRFPRRGLSVLVRKGWRPSGRPPRRRSGGRWRS